MTRLFDTLVLPVAVFLAIAAVTTFDVFFSDVSIWQKCDPGHVRQITSGSCLN
jgi:hypothetical protein